MRPTLSRSTPTSTGSRRRGGSGCSRRATPARRGPVGPKGSRSTTRTSRSFVRRSPATTGPRWVYGSARRRATCSAPRMPAPPDEGPKGGLGDRPPPAWESSVVLFFAAAAAAPCFVFFFVFCFVFCFIFWPAHRVARPLARRLGAGLLGVSRLRGRDRDRGARPEGGLPVPLAGELVVPASLEDQVQVVLQRVAIRAASSRPNTLIEPEPGGRGASR